MQVAFTYVGTIVGAGFASGQEILQFFTRYGAAATGTIALAAALFVWIGTKLMLMAHDAKARSYEDLNVLLFGERAGKIVSLFTLAVLFGISSVMLAGGGTVFSEQLSFSFQAGLWITMAASYAVIARGMKAIMTVNTVVVPIMTLFSLVLVVHTLQSPGSEGWLRPVPDADPLKIWTAPLLYTGFNLATAQAVLVPLGSQIGDRRIIAWGGIAGGACIGALLWAAHFALSARMPGIGQYEIPMASLMSGLGPAVQLVYVFVIYGEIFTTYLANVYGVMLQLKERTGRSAQVILIVLLAGTYLISQIGFKTLLSFLYPLFGLISMAWLALMIIRKREA